MKNARVLLWIMILLMSSFMVLNGGSVSIVLAESAGAFEGEYGGYTQSEKGSTGFNYSAIHTRSIGSMGNASGKTYSEIYSPEYGVQLVSCTSVGTVTAKAEGFIEITSKQTCTNSEYELNVKSICTGTGLTTSGYTELFCIDSTVEFPGYEAINTTILKRK